MTMIPRRKLNAVDKKAIEIQVEIAALVLEPDEYSIRAIFPKLMPNLFVMRKRGVSYGKIHEILIKAGLPLSVSTLKNYYSKHLANMTQDCEKHFRKVQKRIDEIDINPAVGDQKNFAKTMFNARDTTVSAESKTISDRNWDSAPKKGLATAASTTSKSQFIDKRGGQVDDYQSTVATQPSKTTDAQTTSIPSFGSADISAQKSAVSVEALMAKPSTQITKQRLQRSNGSAVIGAAVCIASPNPVIAVPHAGVPPEVYLEGPLEHPAIPGLMLTRDQRLFPDKLEYQNAEGELCEESAKEAVHRLEWQIPIPATETRTSGDFVKMDASILGKRPATLK